MSSEERRARSNSMDPIQDVVMLEEYQPNYAPVVTERKGQQHVTKQYGINARRLSNQLDSLSRQQVASDKQADKDRQALEKELAKLTTVSGSSKVQRRKSVR